MKPFLTLLIAVTFVASFSTALAKDKPVNILVLGDSLSAGLGVTTEQAYPSLVQQMFNQKTDHYVNITNGSISGSTSAGAVSRLKWFLRIKPDILILALGANDGLRGLSTQLMTQNLESAITLAQTHHIHVILAGMKIPPNYGPRYTRDFESVFILLAEQHQLSFIPFLLDGVAGDPSLNQVDGIHPNPDGHKIISETVFKFLLEQI